MIRYRTLDNDTPRAVMQHANFRVSTIPPNFIPHTGDLYYDVGIGQARIYDGKAWIKL